MSSRAILVALTSTCAAGCGASSIERGPGALRYNNEPPVLAVADRDPISDPRPGDLGLVEYYFVHDVIEPARQALTIEDNPRAQNINSLGAVPDSSWFENRRLTPQQILEGPGGGRLPDQSRPWRVTGVKIGGAAIGLTIKDGAGDLYLLKFDERGFAETESAADVIVQRLTWAFGYNVPENQVVEFARSQLELDPEATMKNRAGDERPMTLEDLEEHLALAESDNGTYRALASRFIDGKILGGFAPEGVRDDDPNDRVPHELRRDLRGQRVLWSWVNNVDLKTKNTLDTYTDEGFIKHYAIDFGKSLGTWARIDGLQRLGHRDDYGIAEAVVSLLTLGIHVHPWEKRIEYPQYRGIGHLDVELFEHASWVANHNWRPVDLADRFDELWAAEILFRLRRPHIEAAVAAGKYSDPRATRFVVDALLERKRRIGESVFSRVAPLTSVSVTERRSSPRAASSIEICFDDLWLLHGFEASRGRLTRYRARSFDHDGARVGDATPVSASNNGRGECVPGVPAASGHDGYTIIRIEVERSDEHLPLLFVHVADGPDGVQVIGLDRR